jgi:hypothetical protein
MECTPEDFALRQMAGLAQGAAFYFTLRLQRLLIVFISSMRLERFEFSHHFGRNLLRQETL